MKRRSVLGLAGATIASSFAVGSGAFGMTWADRSMTVEIADDPNAYLGLDPIADAEERSRLYAYEGNVVFRIPGSYEKDYDLTEGEGVGTDAQYWFDTLVKVTNQTNNKLNVYAEHSGTLENAALFDSDDQERTPLTSSDNSYTLGVGESFDAGLYLDTTDVEVNQEYNETISIVAEVAQHD